MTSKEALKRLYDCASEHKTELNEYMQDMDAYQIIADRIASIDVVEKELGIINFLPVLFKALKEGAYFKNPYIKNDICHVIGLASRWEFDKNGFFIRMEYFVPRGWYATGGACFFFKDYGKTWALTREELL